MRIDIDIQQGAAAARAFARAPDILMDELTGATWNAELLLERETKELTPVGVGAGGGLKGSIAAREPERLADSVSGAVGSPLNYVVPVERGSAPHFPPVQPLIDWARAKFGVGEEAERIGYAVARSIAARGTEGAFMFTRALEANRAQIARIYHAAIERALARIAEA